MCIDNSQYLCTSKLLEHMVNNLKINKVLIVKTTRFNNKRFNQCGLLKFGRS